MTAAETTRGRIRWGILGAAHIARVTTAPAIAASSNGKVEAVASRSLEKARAWAKEIGVAKAYGSYDELLADADVDAVYVPLPISMHCEWSIRCAEAGKHVLVEKPIAATADEARRMADAFSRSGLVIAEGLMYTYHPLTRKVLDMVRAGAVGEVRMVTASFNAAVHDPGNIRMRRETGGGGLLDVGSYCVSFLRHATGEEPDDVAALGRYADGDGVDENLAAVLKFPSGVIGYLGCGIKTQFDCSYSVSGTTGRLLVDRGALCAWPGEGFRIRHFHGDDEDQIPVPEANHYTLMVEDFADAVLNDRRPANAVEDAVKNMAVLDRIAKAARSSA